MIQVLFHAMLFSHSAYSGCLPHETIERLAGRDNKKHGELKEGMNWASVRGTVQRPIADLLKALLDHNTTKSPRVSSLEVSNLSKSPEPGLLARHGVHFKIKPFPLITIEWTEEWAYAMSEGDAAQPQSIEISYKKIEGTKYIEHLCGSIVLRKLSADATDIFEYEEAKATRRSAEDTEKGLLGTLESLRKWKG